MQLPDPELPDVRQNYLPDGGDVRNFGKITITKVTPPCKRDSAKTEHNTEKTCSRFQIRAEWWEPVVWWLNNVQWTVLGLGNHGKVNETISCRHGSS